MEIDISGIANNQNKRILLLGMILAVVLVVFGLVGKSYTAPDPEGYPLVLSWSDWRMFSVEQTYYTELKQLRQESDLLANLLNSDPDPVRAQLTAERIERQYRSGLAVLAYQRSLLTTAAVAVQDWSVGAAPREAAMLAVDTFVASLQLPDGTAPSDETPNGETPVEQPAPEDIPASEPTPAPES